MRKLFNDFADKHFPYRKRRIINKNMPEILNAIMINAKFEELGISPIEELDIDVAGYDDTYKVNSLDIDKYIVVFLWFCIGLSIYACDVFYLCIYVIWMGDQ